MYHIPIMVKEVIDGLQIKPNGIYIDGTMGGGGHSLEIASRLTTGKLIAIDQDDDAIIEAKNKLQPVMDRVTIVKDNFSNMDDIIKNLDISKVDGILLDIGVSSHQLDQDDRGFSYRKDARLDMRMDQQAPLSAWHVVNEYEEKELEHVILEYGEERWAKKIAAFIVEARKEKPIDTTTELTQIIKRAIPKSVRMNMKHPAKKVFQGIRIEVNDELTVLNKALDKGISILNPGGRFVVLTFHSLEDRMVKEKFKFWQKDCICPPKAPICQCDKEKVAKIITRKPTVPTKEEIEMNPRSSSSKLRIAEKV